MAKLLNTVFVTEELRAGMLSKRVNAFKWNKRYFAVVPFELRWWTNSKKEGTPKIFPLDENTKLIQKDTKIEIINGDKRIRLRGKDAKVRRTVPQKSVYSGVRIRYMSAIYVLKGKNPKNKEVTSNNGRKKESKEEG